MNPNYLVIFLALVLIIWGGSSLVFVFSSLRKSMSGLQLVGQIAKALSLVLTGVILGLLFWPSNNSDAQGVKSSGSSVQGLLSFAKKGQVIVEGSRWSELIESEKIARGLNAALDEQVVKGRIIPKSFAESIVSRHTEKLRKIARDLNVTLPKAVRANKTKGVYLPLRNITSAIGKHWGQNVLLDPAKLDSAGMYIELATYHKNALMTDLSPTDKEFVDGKLDQNTIVVRLAQLTRNPTATKFLDIVDNNYYNLGTLCPDKCPVEDQDESEPEG